jgi:hypothetical protein
MKCFATHRANKISSSKGNGKRESLPLGYCGLWTLIRKFKKHEMKNNIYCNIASEIASGQLLFIS